MIKITFYRDNDPYHPYIAVFTEEKNTAKFRFTKSGDPLRQDGIKTLERMKRQPSDMPLPVQKRAAILRDELVKSWSHGTEEVMTYKDQ